MICALILSIAVIIYARWYYASYQRSWKYLARFPGPQHWPVVGCLLEFNTKPEEQLRVIYKWLKQFDYQPFHIYTANVPNVVISHPKNIETVLSSTNLLYKADIYTFMKPWLGQGLLTSNGLYWAKHRKLITPSFHFRILQDFLHIMNETTERFVRYLDQYAQTGNMIDFQDIITLSTLDIICECAMGYRLNSIDGGQSPIIKALNDICHVIQERSFSASKRSNFLFSFTADYRVQENSLKILHRELFEIIESRRKFLQTQSIGNNNRNDNFADLDYKRPKMAFLDNLLTAEIDGVPLTLEEIFEEVSTFIFEGHDTTASGLGFAVYCLSRHPKVQQKAYEEQYKMFGGDLTLQPTHQELQDMKYLELVIKESLRLFPSVPIILRTTTTMTEMDGHLVPPDTNIIMALLGPGMNERLYEQPFKFRPERFEVDNRAQANPFHYVPFSAGPRNCVGQKFAIMELKSTISKLLRHFEILPATDGLGEGIHNPTEPLDSRPNPYDVRLYTQLTLKSSNGIFVRLQRRCVE